MSKRDPSKQERPNRSIVWLRGVALFVALLYGACSPLPAGVKTCKVDKDCEGGMVCAVEVCRSSCVPNVTGSCPKEETCYLLPSGKAACVPNDVLKKLLPQDGLGPGELCEGKACKQGLLCAKSSQEKDFHCRVVCDPSKPLCPPGYACGDISGSGGKGACFPSSTPPTGLGPGELCEGKVCKQGLLCAKSPQEKDFHCRALCDPNKPTCPADHFCGAISGSGGKGACFPNPKGTVDEFGRCGGSYGDCTQSPLKMVCVVDPNRTPQYGFCLRECDAKKSCRQGFHCIASLNACAEDCDTEKDNCSYGSCRRLSSMPSHPVCY